MAEGLASGTCVGTLSPLEGLGTLPLATTVNGQMLTSVETMRQLQREAGSSRCSTLGRCGCLGTSLHFDLRWARGRHPG